MKGDDSTKSVSRRAAPRWKEAAIFLAALAAAVIAGLFSPDRSRGADLRATAGPGPHSQAPHHLG
jgi:hypothetical protein